MNRLTAYMYIMTDIIITAVVRTRMPLVVHEQTTDDNMATRTCSEVKRTSLCAPVIPSDLQLGTALCRANSTAYKLEMAPPAVNETYYLQRF